MNPASRIVFFGTPEFARESLRALIEGGYHVAGVVTAPDKPAGRGMKLLSSRVKQYALDQRLTVMQPERLSDPEFLDQLKNLEPDIQVVVAFRMLPRVVWAMPRVGTFNLHASLLPQYRGAAPINWAIINGETRTGLTTFFLQDKIDTGEIIFRESLPIGHDETAGELHERMKTAGASMVIKTVEHLIAGNIQTVNQADLIDPSIPLRPAPKITSETCRIDWTKPSSDIYNLIRGLSPVPAAFTEVKLKDGRMTSMKILRATLETEGHSGIPGSIISDGRNFLKVPASDGDINICELQLSGHKPLKTEDFLRGFGRNII